MIDSVEEFIRLVKSDDPVQRRRSAWEDAPLSVWLAITKDHPDMRFWVANNRTAPEEVLRILALDGDWRVRKRVASKASCPGGILELLSSDPHDSVASSVAGHPNSPPSALRRLAHHPWDQVREKATRQLAMRDSLVSEVGEGTTAENQSE